MERSQFAAVIFDQVAETYPTDSDVTCQFELTDTLEASRWDWVGLYKVGWTKQNDYLHYQYVTIPDGYTKGKKVPFKIVWSAKILPKEDGDFYQFCYVSYAQGISGASTPFQFRRPRAADFVEEEFEGMMVVRPKTVVMQEEIQNLQHKLMVLNQERDSMVERLTSTQKKLDTRDMMITNLQSQVNELQDAATETSQQCAKLQAQREALLGELDVRTKEREKLCQEMESLRAELKNMEQTVAMLKGNLKDMKSCEDELSGQNQSLNVELNAYKMQVTESQSLAAQYSKRIEELQSTLEETTKTRDYLSEEFAKLIQQEDDRALQHEQHRKELEHLRTEKGKLERQCDDLSNEVQNAKDMLMACQSMKEKLVSDLSAYEQTQIQMNHKLESQESEVRELLERLEHVTKDCSDTKKLLNIKTEELAKVKMELQASENNLKQVLFEVHDSARRQAESKQRHEVVEKEKAKASKQLDEMSAELQKTREEKEALQVQLRTFEDDLQGAMAAKEREVTGKEEEVARMSSLLEEKEEEIKEREAIITEQAAKLKSLSADLKTRTEEHEKLSEVMYQFEEERESLYAEKAEALNDLEKKSREDEAARFVLKSTNDCLSKRIQEKDAELNRLRQELSDLEGQVTDLRQRLEVGKTEYKEKAMENQKLERMLKKQTMLLRKASDSGASSPATPHKSVEGESSPAGPLVRSLSCDSSNGGDAAVADYDRYKYRQKYKLEKKDKEAKLQAMQARHAEQLADKDNQIDLIVTDSERLRRQIRSVEMDKETLEMACEVKDDRIRALESRISELMTRLGENSSSTSDDEREEEREEEEKDAEEEEAMATEAKLMYGNPFAAAAPQTAETEPEKQTIIRSTFEEEEAGSMEPLIEASTDGDRLPPPLMPEVVPAAAAADDLQTDEAGQEIFEDCAAELPRPLADDSFMDAIGEGMKICPYCEASVFATSDFEEHVATHFGRICPVCKSQADDTMTPEDFEQHVNKCLDSEATTTTPESDEPFQIL